MTEHTAADFAAARFAQHPDGRIAARVAYLSNHPWIVQAGSVWVWATDQNMADQGWRIVTPAPDPSDPDVIEQAAQRARDAYHAGHARPWEDAGEDFKGPWRDAARAALTPPPTRDPEAEKLEAVLRSLDDPEGRVPAPVLTDAQFARLADLLTEHGVRVRGGEG